ncbi:MAG: FKBP-type peptidyl-prolyl cis-trans isomerase [Sphingomicrobium sp.]
MSASTPAHPKSHSGVGKLWLGLLALVAAGVALAWIGAGSLRGETTPSGLRFRTVTAGSGPQIKAVDGVLVEYEGRLMDGTVFDSSEGRGPTPMIAGQVIPGFAEALTRMQKGGRYKIIIPSNLGYGETQPPGSAIPPNSDLDFDVHVVQVVPNAALMQGRHQPGGGQPGVAQPEAAPPQP